LRAEAFLKPLTLGYCYPLPSSLETPKLETDVTNIVLGARGMVGSLIVERLARSGGAVVGVSRTKHQIDGIDWIDADLASPGINLPKAEIVYCATDARISAMMMKSIIQCGPKRVILFSTTGIISKVDSSDEAERTAIAEIAEAERTAIEACEESKVEWTILRPPLIYLEGRDKSITRIANLIRAIGFMPLYGTASGLRQPVHAADVARGAIAAAVSSTAANKTYTISGFDTISYREMVGRIFDGLGRRRRMVSLAPTLWKFAFALVKPVYPTVTTAMGERMLKDLAFDSSDAVSDFGWDPRGFAPFFQAAYETSA
jgi:nucleoside-diphosphate-sugar epimerase